MTGLVIEAALNLGAVLRINGVYALSEITLYRQLITIGTFLTGCVCGAVVGKWCGLSAVLLPGFLLTIYSVNAGLARGETANRSSTL
jgi:uncharacterized membrane protein YoaK (UPF0700 family)